jgi:hypothetical protein
VIGDTYSETREVLKNDLVILARGGRGRTKRGERCGLRRSGGGRPVWETSIIGTGREGRRGTRSAPGGPAAIGDSRNIREDGRGEGGMEGRRD